MEARRDILRATDVHYSAKLPPILGRITRSQHAHGFDLIGIERWRKRWRTILCQRQSVEDKLHVVFRTARMQHAVRFINPPGLIVDEIGKRSARLRRNLFFDRILADGVRHARARRIDQRRGIGNFHLRGDRGHAQRDRKCQRNFRTNLQHAGPFGESLRSKACVITPERQPLHDTFSVCANSELAPQLIQDVPATLKWMTHMAAGGKHLANQFGLTWVVVKDSNSHSCQKL